MRIIHTVPSYPGLGGVQTYLDDLLPLLAAAGHDVQVVAKQASAEPTPENFSNIRVISSEHDVIRHIKKADPDILHIHEWPAGAILKAFFCFPERPKIIIHHQDFGFVCPGDRFFWSKTQTVCPRKFGLGCMANAYLKRCQKSRKPTEVLRSYFKVLDHYRSLRRADLFLALSNDSKKRLVECGVPEQKCAVLNYFTVMQCSSKISPRPGRIFYCGRFDEAKGFRSLFAALSQLKKNIKWSLVIAGEGCYAPAIKNMIQKFGLEKKIELVGWVTGEKKTNLYQEAQLVVFPSLWPETFGRVGIEAMACARPVVAFNIGGIPDWLMDGVNGFVVPLGDVQALVNRLEMLLCDQNLSEKMGQKGLEIVNEKFRPQKHLEKLLRLYGSLNKGVDK